MSDTQDINLKNLSQDLIDSGDLSSKLIEMQSQSFGLYELIIVVLIFVLAIAAFYFSEKLLRAGHDSISVMRSIGIISIIFSSVLLIVLGYSKEQINVVLTLFGTIAGYLLGKSDRKKN